MNKGQLHFLAGHLMVLDSFALRKVVKFQSSRFLIDPLLHFLLQITVSQMTRSHIPNEDII